MCKYYIVKLFFPIINTYRVFSYKLFKKLKLSYTAIILKIAYICR
jgi:hypothetical protein